jgi:hypothetical protein
MLEIRIEYSTVNIVLSNSIAHAPLLVSIEQKARKKHRPCFKVPDPHGFSWRFDGKKTQWKNLLTGACQPLSDWPPAVDFPQQRERDHEQKIRELEAKVELEANTDDALAAGLRHDSWIMLLSMEKAAAGANLVAASHVS